MRVVRGDPGGRRPPRRRIFGIPTANAGQVPASTPRSSPFRSCDSTEPRMVRKADFRPALPGEDARSGRGAPPLRPDPTGLCRGFARKVLSSHRYSWYQHVVPCSRRSREQGRPRGHLSIQRSCEHENYLRVRSAFGYTPQLQAESSGHMMLLKFRHSCSSSQDLNTLYRGGNQCW